MDGVRHSELHRRCWHAAVEGYRHQQGAGIGRLCSTYKKQSHQLSSAYPVTVYQNRYMYVAFIMKNNSYLNDS